MTEKKRVCTCAKCGNEAEMLIRCEWVDVEKSPGSFTKEQKETITCTLCGNEADMIVNSESFK